VISLRWKPVPHNLSKWTPREDRRAGNAGQAGSTAAFSPGLRCL